MFKLGTVLVLFFTVLAVNGCSSSSEEEVSQNDVTEISTHTPDVAEASTTAPASGGPSCLLDSEYVRYCYEGDPSWVKKQCDHFKKVNGDMKVTYSPHKPCPRDKGYAGHCIESEYTMFYYDPDNAYDTAKKRADHIADLKEGCYGKFVQ